jgi:site-specific recombinase XerD
MWSKDFHQNTLLRWLGSRLCLNQKPSLFLSLDKNGRERITTRTVERWIKEIAKKAGITKRIHPHMFRHAKAHYMKAHGADLKDIQMMLGHVSPYSALMYLNFDKNEMLNNARKYL